MPQSSGQQMAAWSPAATPRRVWPSMMRAVRPTTETSASSAATSPAPTAGPWIADTIGFEQSMTLTTRSRASRIVRRRAVVVGDHRVDQLEAAAGRERLARAPQQGDVASSGSRSTVSQTSASWRCAAGPTAFRPGASRVIRSTPSRGPVEGRGRGKSAYGIAHTRPSAGTAGGATGWPGPCGAPGAGPLRAALRFDHDLAEHAGGDLGPARRAPGRSGRRAGSRRRSRSSRR